MLAKMSVTALAIVTGKLALITPYRSHKRVPAVNRLYIAREIPEVSFV